MKRTHATPILSLGALATLLTALLWGLPAAAGEPKVQVCHLPPGNPLNFHTITIGASAMDAHLAHGDLGGPCDAHCADLCDDDQDPCTIAECGSGGGCVPPAPVDCSDGDACTTDFCDAQGVCQNQAVTCNDPDLCTVSTCVAGQCVDAPITCDGGAVCDPSGGGCPAVAGCPCLEDPTTPDSVEALIADAEAAAAAVQGFAPTCFEANLSAVYSMDFFQCPDVLCGENYSIGVVADSCAFVRFLIGLEGFAALETGLTANEVAACLAVVQAVQAADPFDICVPVLPDGVCSSDPPGLVLDGQDWSGTGNFSGSLGACLNELSTLGVACAGSAALACQDATIQCLDCITSDADCDVCHPLFESEISTECAVAFSLEECVVQP